MLAFYSKEELSHTLHSFIHSFIISFTFKWILDFLSSYFSLDCELLLLLFISFLRFQQIWPMENPLKYLLKAFSSLMCLCHRLINLYFNMIVSCASSLK